MSIQIHVRFLKFIHSVITSDNRNIEMCGKLVLNGSRSTTCENLNYICYIYSLNKLCLNEKKLCHLVRHVHNVDNCNFNADLHRIASVVSDMMYLREFPYLSELGMDDIQTILNFACTG